MALCFTCHRVVDIEAEVCGNCGRPNPTKERSPEKIKRRIVEFFFIFIILPFIAVIYSSAFLGEKNQQPKVEQEPSSTIPQDLPEASQIADSNTIISDSQQTTQPLLDQEQNSVITSTNSQTVDLDAPIEQDLKESDKPALTTYYFQVLREGREETISISAPNPERAIEIVKDFRGNPPILQGPEVELKW